MDNIKSYFDFFNDTELSLYITDSLLAVMRTTNGPNYMKTKNEYKTFDKRNCVVKSIDKNMIYNHNSKTFNFLLKFIESIYKNGYVFTKYEYIRKQRPDIMKAIRIIENQRIKYLNEKNQLEMSMDFEDLRLDMNN